MIIVFATEMYGLFCHSTFHNHGNGYRVQFLTRVKNLSDNRMQNEYAINSAFSFLIFKLTFYLFFHALQSTWSIYLIKFGNIPLKYFLGKFYDEMAAAS